MPVTVQQVIDILLGAVHSQGADPIANTVDVLHAGSPTTPVTGIAACFLATQDVLQRAVRLNCNLVLTHEPTFYNHRGDTEWLKDDPVYAAKRAYLDEHKLAVFRYHDYWHKRKPDGILAGMVRQFGWEAFQNEPGGRFFTLPAPTPLRALTEQLKSALNLSHLRVAGDLDRAVQKICLNPGWGDRTNLPKYLNQHETDVLIIGETHEWETPEYVRDAVTQGANKALIVLGHADSEEAGMAYLLEWLVPKLPEPLPLHYVPSRNPFLIV